MNETVTRIAKEYGIDPHAVAGFMGDIMANYGCPDIGTATVVALTVLSSHQTWNDGVQADTIGILTRERWDIGTDRVIDSKLAEITQRPAGYTGKHRSE